jgi:hypothetical protein
VRPRDKLCTLFSSSSIVMLLCRLLDILLRPAGSSELPESRWDVSARVSLSQSAPISASVVTEARVSLDGSAVGSPLE